jgi:hypothetical protein
MEAVGTATTPGQTFFITPVYDSTHQLHRWTVTADEALLVYEEDDFQPQKLTPSLLLKYRMQKVNLAFAKDYLATTGRAWLSYFLVHHRSIPCGPLSSSDKFMALQARHDIFWPRQPNRNKSCTWK